MSTLNPRRFTKPETLKSINGTSLISFLNPYRDFLENRKFELPSTFDDEYDYEPLVTILMSPDTDTPGELSEALFFIDEMSTEDGMDTLLAEAKTRNLTIKGGQDITPADVAVQIWLQDKDILKRKHTEQHLGKLRKFEYYQMDAKKPPSIPKNLPKIIPILEANLNKWYAENRRGQHTVQISAFPKVDEIWFLIRHGGSFRREGSIENGKSKSIFFRPEEYDVVVYNQKIGEIRMNPNTNRERELYRKKFGLYLFGDENSFPGTGKYTLEPLRVYGSDSLTCIDVNGMEWVKLKEIHYFWGGGYGEIDTKRADDVFAAMKERGKTMPVQPRIIRAKFEIKFKDAKKTRQVVICPSNIAKYTCDDDSVIIEDWLTRRGFIVKKESTENDIPKVVLAIA